MQNLFALQCRKAGFNLPGQVTKLPIFRAKLHDFLLSGARMDSVGETKTIQKPCQLSNTEESVLIVDVKYVPTSVCVCSELPNEPVASIKLNFNKALNPQQFQ